MSNNLDSMEENMKENRVALFTMCSDDLVEVCLTMLYSFLMNNKWFYDCGTINIICDNNICKLEPENREKFTSLYENTVFIEPDYEYYKPLIEHQEKELSVPQNFKPCSYKYEIFKDYGYSKNVFFDADMIIQSDVRELFFNNITFGVCLDISALKYKTNIIFNKTENTDAYFNAGLMIVGKNIMKEEVYNKIFTFTKSLTPQYNFSKKLSWKGVLIEQDAINELFVNYTLIPHELYNQSHLLINNLNYKDTKIIHYCGAPKPWKEINFRFEMAAMIFYKYYFMRTNNFTLLNNDKKNN